MLDFQNVIKLWNISTGESIWNKNNFTQRVWRKIDFRQQYRKKESRKYNSLWLASDDDYIKDVINFLDNCDKAIITVAAKKRQMYIKGDGIAFKARQYHYIKKAKFLYQVINMAKKLSKNDLN